MTDQNLDTQSGGDQAGGGSCIRDKGKREWRGWGTGEGTLSSEQSPSLLYSVSSKEAREVLSAHWHDLF